ncbi:hypothetical protein MBLNU13_g01755t1 [Cladosporium sp. NU13]
MPRSRVQLRLSWNGRPVNLTLLLALLLADAISTLYRLTLGSRATLRANQPATSPRHYLPVPQIDQTSMVSFHHATRLSLSRVSLPEHSPTGMVSDVDSYSSEAARIGLLHIGTDRSRAR